MRAIRLPNLLLVVFFLALSGCQYSTLAPPLPLAQLALEAIQEPQLTFRSIAYYNEKFRAVPIQQSSGNPMRDALEALFASGELSDQFQSMELDEIAKYRGQTTYSFAAIPQFSHSMDGNAMPERFTIAIGRNQRGLNYSIEFLNRP